MIKKKKKVSRFKLQRRLMCELPGLGKAGAIERKPYPPGQHGMRRIKYSDYRIQLEEKQKVRIHYNLREEQLLRMVKRAKAGEGAWVSKLIGILETRLQNVIFRAGFASSQMSAAQMISHGHVLVNDKIVDIRSAAVFPGDVVSLNSKGLKNQIYLFAKQKTRLPMPDWLEKNESETSATVKLKEVPGAEAVPFPFEAAFVTSYYSKV